MSGESSSEGPVLHVIVIGFHHKRGCQVDYSYPPLIKGEPVDSSKLPQEWKYLPSLALPDGAHNFQDDTTYFHLPSLQNPRHTVFGVSCYRQIAADNLKNKGEDVTRASVQKSVCVIATVPLYGVIQAKLELITSAYFEERDFSQVKLLEDTFSNLNTSLTSSIVETQLFFGLSPHDLILQYRHKVLILFKLLLLERKVLFYGTPVKTLSTGIMTLLSLFPGMLECGMAEAVYYQNEIINHHLLKEITDKAEDALEVSYEICSEQDVIESSAASEKISTELPKNDDSKLLASVEVSECVVGNVFDTCPSENSTSADVGDVGESNVNSTISTLLHSTSSDTHDSHLHEYLSEHGQMHGDISKTAQDKTDVVDSTSISKPKNSVKSETYKSNSDKECLDLNDIKSLVDDSHDEDEKKERFRSLSDESSTNVVKSRLRSSSQRSGIVFDNVSDLSKRGAVMLPFGYSDEIVDSDSKQSFKIETDKDSVVHSTDGGDCEHLAAGDKTCVNERLNDLPKVEEDSSNCPLDPTVNLIVEDARANLQSIDDVTLEQAIEAVEFETSSANNFSQNSSVWDSSWENKQFLHEIDEVLKGDSHVKLSRPVRSESETSLNTKLSAYSRIGSMLGRVTGFSSSNSLDKLNEKEFSEASSAKSFTGEISPEELDALNLDDCGFPLDIFGRASVCYPYMCLAYIDKISEPGIHSFVGGASNVLFKHKRHLHHAVFDTNSGKLEVHDPELSKQLSLTAADLRFADYLVRVVSSVHYNGAYDASQWEGGDDWIRVQFKWYLVCMLSTWSQKEVPEGQKSLEDFNMNFIMAWSKTNNFNVWNIRDHSKMGEKFAGHPFNGQISMADMKLRLQHVLQNSERGKKVNQAVQETGKAVIQTGKVVGSAISSAGSAMSGTVSTWLGWK